MHHICSADSHYTTSVMSTDIFVNYEGNVTWLAAAIFKSSCQMNVRYYPFDEQVVSADS
jgi:nicotinic acetylcholine receptor